MRRWTSKSKVQISLLAIGVVTLCSLLFLRHQNENDSYFRYRANLMLPEKFKDKVLPFHQIYESRNISLEGYNKILHHQPTTDKLILVWTPWNKQWETINYYSLQLNRISFTKDNCPNTKCIVTINRSRIREADAVIFHLLDTKVNDLPAYRHSNQIWILYNIEAPWLVNSNFKNMDGLFNWTMSYREDSDVTVKYGVVAKKNDFSTEKTPNLKKKKPIVWFSSDCKTDSRREDYVKELSRHISVDIYGNCGNKKCFPAQSDYCYGKVLNDYYFYLSFENSICRDYVTEKFFNILNYDIVPVVMGGANYSNLAPVDSFIDALKYPNPKDLAGFMQGLIKDETLYLKYFKWKERYSSYLHPWSCYLCDKIHAKIERKPWNNLQHWWTDDAECKRWVLDTGFKRL